MHAGKPLPSSSTMRLLSFSFTGGGSPGSDATIRKERKKRLRFVQTDRRLYAFFFFTPIIFGGRRRAWKIRRSSSPSFLLRSLTHPFIQRPFSSHRVPSLHACPPIPFLIKPGQETGRKGDRARGAWTGYNRLGRL